MRVRGVFILVLGYGIYLSFSLQLHAQKAIDPLYSSEYCKSPHPIATKHTKMPCIQPCSECRFLTGVFVDSPFQAMPKKLLYLTLVPKTWKWNCCYKKRCSAISLVQHSQASSVPVWDLRLISPFRCIHTQIKKRISESCWSSAPPRARPGVTTFAWLDTNLKATSISPWELKPKWFLTQWGIRTGNQISLFSPWQ